MKKNEILKVALKISNEDGIENLSMRKLASEVGCTPSTLYHHFKDKNELLNELILYVDDCMDKNFTNHDISLEELVRNMMEYNSERNSYHKFLGMHHNASFLSDVTKSHLKERRDARKKVWQGFVEAGELRSDLNKKSVYYVLMGMARTIAGEPNIDDEIRDDVAQIIYRGFTGYNFGLKNEIRRDVRSRMRKQKRHRRENVRSCHNRKIRQFKEGKDNERNISKI